MRNGPSKVVFRVHSPENGVVALEPEHFYPAVYTLSSTVECSTQLLFTLLKQSNVS